MKPFLYKVAEEVYKKHGGRLENVCIVFPNRRSGLYLKKYLAEIVNKNFWAPEIYSIEDFIVTQEPARVPDDITLIFELFNIYKKYEPSETIEGFYPWGEMLLEDFNEIDKNLADADLLFKRIRDYKIMEKEFDFLEDEDREDLKRFLEAFTGRETPHKKNFTEIWEVTGKVYNDFRKSLKEKNLAYAGMLYRNFAERLRSDQADSSVSSLRGKYDMIYFAGFNNLSKAEEEIIRTLYEKKLADIFFDADKYYLDDHKQEAGKYIRKFIKKIRLKELKWNEDLLSKEEKNISIFSAPLITGQIKAVCNELQKLSEEKDFIPEKTAVVIPEESLLLPLLNSIPGSIKDVNITAGYSLKYTSLFTLFSLLKDLQLNSFVRNGECYFRLEDVSKILSHPYANYNKELTSEFISKMIEDMWISIPGAEIHKWFKNELIFFNCPATPDECFEYLYSIMNFIRAKITGEELSFIEKEQFFHFYKHMNRLRDIITKADLDAGRRLFWEVLIDILRNQRIPFTGEPLKGIQILGTLETRLLDFENIFILSMNEGSFPANRVSNSFIPYSLRKAFGLPVYDDDQCSSAYIFYRLLQRGKNINLFYNSDAASFSKGEKSRYIIQVELELARINSNIRLSRKNVSVKSGMKELPVLQVRKTDTITRKLQEINYSPSAISTYLNCPMQFYLSRVAGLEEPETAGEWMDASQFGNIFHGTMQGLYEKFINKVVAEEDIESLSSDIDNILDDAFARELRQQAKALSGRSELMKRVIKKLVLNMLELDKKIVPFKIIELEKNIEDVIVLNGRKIKLKGKIDRIDEAEGKIRIIDYKTSNVEIKGKGKKDTLEDYFEKIVSENKKELFQAYFYSYLYLKRNPAGNLTAGVCSARAHTRGFQLICEEVIRNEDMAIFEENLKKILDEIFNAEISFMQTEDNSKCIYCAYKSICIRE